MALNTFSFKCIGNYLAPLHFKGLKQYCKNSAAVRAKRAIHVLHGNQQDCFPSKVHRLQMCIFSYARMTFLLL